jgi:hypothetical protein
MSILDNFFAGTSHKMKPRTSVFKPQTHPAGADCAGGVSENSGRGQRFEVSKP